MIEDIKAYKPESSSIGSGQVLSCPYTFEKAKLIVKEMTELLVLDLVDKGLCTDQIVLTVGYDMESLKDPKIREAYCGAMTKDRYGRAVPKSAHGTANLERYSSSTKRIVQATVDLYERIVDKDLLIKRLYVTANHVVQETAIPRGDMNEQMDLFTDYAAEQEKREREAEELQRERRVQKAVLSIQKKFGKNAILKGMSLEEGATARERNGQIGGHKA